MSRRQQQRRNTNTNTTNTTVIQNPLVLSILITETAERVAYYGFRAILVLFFTYDLKYTENTAISLFAVTTSVAYFSPLVGAMIADSFLGRYKTIEKFGFMYCVGLCLLTISAYKAQQKQHNNNDGGGVDDDDMDDVDTVLLLERSLTFIGLLLVCIGTGGIKPCVSAFGADQVVLSSSSSTTTTTDTTTTTSTTTTTPTISSIAPLFNEVEPIKSMKSSSSSSSSLEDFVFLDDNGGDDGDGAYKTSSKTTRPENNINIQAEEEVIVVEVTSHPPHSSEEEENYNINNNNNNNEQQQVREYFNIFYFCINVGALTSFAFIPMIRARLGFGYAFLFPTIFMILAMIVFRSKKDSYKHRPQRNDHNTDDPTLLEISIVCFNITKQRIHDAWLFFSSSSHHRTRHHHNMMRIPREEDGDYYSSSSNNNSSSNDDTFNDEFDDDDDDDERRSQQHSRRSSQQHQHQKQSKVYTDASQALHVLPIMLFFPIFWMLYDQQGSVWTLQATRLNLHGFEPEQLQILNPLEIMILLPIFDRVIYPSLENRGYNLQPIRRMEYGMFLTAIAFFVSAWLEYNIQKQQQQQQQSLDSSSSSSSSSSGSGGVSVAWQIPQITILTIAEIFLNVTGLEFAYSQAPTNMQALILALYLFMTTIGNMLGAVLYASIFAKMDNIILSMIICAVCMLLNLVVFTYVVGRWKPYNRKKEYENNSSSMTVKEEEDEVGSSSCGGDDCNYDDGDGGYIELLNRRTKKEEEE